MPKKKKDIQMSDKIQREFEAMANDFGRQQVIIDELAKAHPTWAFVTLFVMSSDMAASERVDTAYLKGELNFDTAETLLGSYARWDWLVREMKKGVINISTFHENMCSWWSMSDPDDTNPEYLQLFKEAREVSPVIPNRGQYIGDEGKNLPPTQYLTIYRGQDDPNETIGFAWTLDLYIAEKFAKGAWARVPRHGVVITARCEYKDVLAYITGRGEQEIIIDPKLIEILNVSDPL